MLGNVSQGGVRRGDHLLRFNLHSKACKFVEELADAFGGIIGREGNVKPHAIDRGENIRQIADRLAIMPEDPIHIQDEASDLWVMICQHLEIMLESRISPVVAKLCQSNHK